MALFVPCSTAFDDAIKNPLSARYLKLLIDTDGDGDLEDVTSYLDNNQVSGGGKGQGELGVSTKEYSARLRNSALGLVDGAWAGRACAIEAKAGTAEYIRIFTGFVSDEGAERVKASVTEDLVDFTMQDPSYSRGMRRKTKPVNYVNYKICDTAAPATSLFHKLAYQLGLADADLETATINQTKDYLPLDGEREAWQELQDLCAQYIGHMTFRYDGKLRFISRHQQGWTEPASEWTFDADNVYGWRGQSAGISCNRCRTEFEKYENLGQRTIYKNTDNWDAANRRNNIAVGAGAYWPGPYAEDKAQLQYKDPASGEDWPVGISIVTPTIGTVGSGCDIECGGGLLTLVSFNGSTGATQQNPNSSEIILRNNTGGTVTIRKFEIRGTPLRIRAKVTVEDVDGTVTDDWKFVDKTIPGKYAVSDTQAHISTQRWVEFGKVERKLFEFGTYWLPQIQEGAVVTFHPDSSINISAVVEAYKHDCQGSPRKWRTLIAVREKESFTPSGSPKVITQAQGEAATEKADATAEDIASRPTYTEVQQGYTQGGGTKTPTQVTVSVCKPVATKAILLQWDRQLNLTNLDHYEIQVSADQVDWYSLKFDGTDWKDQLGGLTCRPFEEVLHANIPHAGTAEAPTGRTLYYHVRRVTKEAANGDWSATASATTKTVAAGDVATDTLYASNVKASEIATFLLRALSAVIIGQDYAGTPPAGAQRVVCDNNEFKLEEYDGSAWQAILRLGGDDMLKWYLSCRGVIKTGADISGLPVGDKAPAGSKIFDFEDDYQDQNGSDLWWKSGTRSFTTGKFSKGLTGNVGSITEPDARGSDWGASFGVDAWLKLTALSPPSALDLLRIGSPTQAPFATKTPASYKNEATLPALARLSASDFVVTYVAVTTAKLYAKIGQVAADGSISYGSEYEALGANVYQLDVHELTSTKFALVYRKASDSYAYAKIGTVSGTAITFGAEAKFSGTDAVAQVRVSRLSDTKLVAGYYTTTGPYVKCAIGDESGGSITFGSVYSVGEISTWFGLDGVSSTLFVIGYCQQSLTKVRTASVSGTTITYNTAVQAAAAGAYDVGICALNSTKFGMTRSTGNLLTRTGTISGTAITLGGEQTLKTGSISGQDCVRCHSSQEDRYAVAWFDTGDDKHQCCMVIAWSDNSIAPSSVTDIRTDSTETMACVVMLSWNRGVTAYNGTARECVSVWQKCTSATLYLDGANLRFSFLNWENSVDLSDYFGVSAGWYHVSVNWNYSTKTLYYTVNGYSASRSLSSYTLDSETLWLTLTLQSSTYANVWDDLLVLADAFLDPSTDSIAHFSAGIPWADPATGVDALLDLILLAKAGGTVKALSQFVPLAGLDWPTLHVRDEQASGTGGGGFTSGAWYKRILNTVKKNTITGASVTDSVITLPAGTYEIDALAPARGVDSHKAKLYNTTDSADAVIGSSSFATAYTAYGASAAFVRGQFTIAAQKNFELQHRCSTSRPSDGFGTPSGFGVVEVYAEVIIRKVA